MIKAVIFLGNPGKPYIKTRHNAGWMLEAYLNNTTDGWKKKFKGEWTKFSYSSKVFLFLKPQTFMNESGQSVEAFRNFFNLEPREILVVHDDLELPLGTIAARQGGGTGGHNGLKSIIKSTGSSDFYRLRFGIGRPKRGSVSSFVLSPFSKDEEILAERALEEASKLILKIMFQGNLKEPVKIELD